MASKTAGSAIIEVSNETLSLIEKIFKRITDLEAQRDEQNEYIKRLEKKIPTRRSASNGSKSDNSRRVTALFKKLEKPEYAHVITAKDENNAADKIGSIRVGKLRSHFDKGGGYPITEGYLNIAVTSHNKAGVGFELSPFVLTGPGNRNFENIWQFAKYYPFVPDMNDVKSEWKWKREVHVAPKTQSINDEYWAWRKAGMEHNHPVRYPVGTNHRQYARGHIWPVSGKLEDAVNMDSDTPREIFAYVPARIKIYCPIYMDLAQNTDDFKTLLDLLKAGYNLQILDVDGPSYNPDKKPYDQMLEGDYGQSGVGSIEINEDNIKAMLVDETQAFGHGYALACALLGHPEWITEFPIESLPKDEGVNQNDKGSKGTKGSNDTKAKK